MRTILLVISLGFSMGLLQACTLPPEIAGATTHCDEYEGYPDCYPDSPISQ